MMTVEMETPLTEAPQDSHGALHPDTRERLFEEFDERWIPGKLLSPDSRQADILDRGDPMLLLPDAKNPLVRITKPCYTGRDREHTTGSMHVEILDPDAPKAIRFCRFTLHPPRWFQVAKRFGGPPPTDLCAGIDPERPYTRGLVSSLTTETGQELVLYLAERYDFRFTD